MWTTANRPKYNRDKLRYPSDLTGEEWAHIEALIPAAKHGGRKRTVDVREVVNGIMYVLSTGCQWRYVPKDLPPKSTLYDYFDLWTYDGTLETIHHALYVKCREQIGREASPTAAIIDSQSVKSAEKGGAVSTHRATMQCSSLYLILQTASFWRWPVHCRWWSGSDHFFPRNRDGVKECLQRRLAEAPAALMRSLLVVAFDP